MFRFFYFKSIKHTFTGFRIISNFQLSIFNFQFIRTFAAVKKIIRFCLLLPLLFLMSCSSKPLVEPPADLIAEDTIVQLVAEQLVIESTVFSAPPDYDKDGLTRAFYSQLFEKYNVSMEDGRLCFQSKEDEKAFNCSLRELAETENDVEITPITLTLSETNTIKPYDIDALDGFVTFEE